MPSDPARYWRLMPALRKRPTRSTTFSSGISPSYGHQNAMPRAITNGMPSRSATLNDRMFWSTAWSFDMFWLWRV